MSGGPAAPRRWRRSIVSLIAKGGINAAQHLGSVRAGR
jgi:hypothetical protein